MSTAEVPKEEKMDNVFIFMGDFKLHTIEQIFLNATHSSSAQHFLPSYFFGLHGDFFPFRNALWFDLILLSQPTHKCRKCISKKDIIIAINTVTLRRVSMMSPSPVYSVCCPSHDNVMD